MVRVSEKFLQQITTLAKDGYSIVDGNSARIVNVADPTNNQDLATKSYVDSISGSTRPLYPNDGQPYYDKTYGRMLYYNQDAQMWLPERVGGEQLLSYTYDGIYLRVTLDTDFVIQIEYESGGYKDLRRITQLEDADGNRLDFYSAWEHANATGGEWMGSSHGNEMDLDYAILVDGYDISANDDISGTARVIVVRQESQLLLPTTHEPVATLNYAHIISGHSVFLMQHYEWLAIVPLTNVYAQMLPINENITNRGRRGKDTPAAILYNIDQQRISANALSQWSAGGGMRFTSQLELITGPPTLKAFFQSASNPNKGYLQVVNTTYNTAIGEMWEWGGRYYFEQSDYLSEMAEIPFNAFWTANDDAANLSKTEWRPTAGSIPAIGENSPPWGIDSFDATSIPRPGISCLKASSQAFNCDWVGDLGNNPTTLLFAIHVDLQTLTSSDSICSLGSTDGNYFIRIRVASSATEVQLESSDPVMGSVSGPKATITTGEHVIVAWTDCTTAWISVDGATPVSGAFVIYQTLLDAAAINARRVGGSNLTFGDAIYRRFGVAANKTLPDNPEQLISTAWLGR